MTLLNPEDARQNTFSGPVDSPVNPRTYCSSPLTLRFCVSQPRNICSGCLYEVGRRKQNLGSPNPSGDGYHCKRPNGLIYVNWIFFLCRERGYSASDITCQFL